MRTLRRDARRRTGTVVASSAVVALLVSGCTQQLPASVVEGSTVTVGWSQSLTSVNVASRTGDTAGNREIAAVTRDGFARLAGDEVVEDESFGTVEVIDPDPSSFTVSYDLAERSWSDGIAIDAADLLLAWIAGAEGSEAFDSVPTELRASSSVPVVDDFARRIEVTFERPVRHWHTALDVAVPAHVVGEMALGIEDPMEAKQAVVDAITEDDQQALDAIAGAWSSGFDLDSVDGELPEALAVSSGPYLVAAIDPARSTSDLTLLVNRRYDGDSPPSYERIDVVAGDDPLSVFPDGLDVVQLTPTPDNFAAVRYLERRDHHVGTTHAGQLWTLVLRADTGVFGDRAARRAFLRAISPNDLRSAGAGDWADVYPTTQSLLFAPESDGYEISLEDAGYRAAFEQTSVDADVERARAGVAAGTEVCVLYDTDEPFATGAFQGLSTSLAEAGWAVRDCGQADVESSLGRGLRWQAVLTTVTLPRTAEDITTVWGGSEPSVLSGTRSAQRRRLAAQISATADVYDARDLLVGIEASLIREAVALPLALDPVLTLSGREMLAVLPDAGVDSTLLGTAAGWEPAS